MGMLNLSEERKEEFSVSSSGVMVIR
jgi:hypothetical protein